MDRGQGSEIHHAQPRILVDTEQSIAGGVHGETLELRAEDHATHDLERPGIDSDELAGAVLGGVEPTTCRNEPQRPRHRGLAEIEVDVDRGRVSGQLEWRGTRVGSACDERKRQGGDDRAECRSTAKAHGNRFQVGLAF